MADNVHVVPHFHWDREWYFTAEESKILLVNDMEEILTMLETNPDYPCFVMDGQTSILEDYFSVKPENRGRVKALTEQGKLIIGPWYTQTDEMVVGGESIVRNLLYGTLDCEEFGPRMDIGYLPDSFGQSARLPQILNGFGINRCMFWRGTSERMGTDKTEFYWEGDDGARVLVQLLPLGYAIGKYLPVDSEELKKRLDKYFPVLDKGATTDHILLPNGHDQMPIQKDIFEVMKQIEASYPGRKVDFSRYETVFEKAEQVPDLAVLHGEFLDGKYMRVHRSIYSSRADLKTANTRIENKITNILEPLMSIAYSLGFSYEHGLTEAIWKELLKNHAHDSIGCCCSDKVHRAIADRFFLAEDRTDNLIEFYKRKIVDAISCEKALDKFTVFNLLPYERTGVITGEVITKMKNFCLTDETGREIPFEVLDQKIVDAGLIDRQIVHYGDYDPFVRYQLSVYDTIPSMGYLTYLIKEKQGQIPSPVIQAQPDILENQYYKILINDNGTLQILDKNTGVEYQEALLLEDGSDDGDGYDFSPLKDDFIIISKQAKAETIVRHYENLTTADITLTLAVPKDLNSRKQNLIDSEIELVWKITLKKDSPIIEINLTADNHAKDHRLRVLVANPMPSTCSLSDNQFGSISRSVSDPAMKVWEQERWSERPDSIYPFLTYIHTDSPEGMAVLTNSIREYEITGETYNTIAVTIFRGVGVLGKENLFRRPGRPSGIKMEAPDSQLLGKQEYQFAITSQTVHAPRLAKEYLTPPVTYNKMPYHAMKLNPSNLQIPYRYSLLSITNEAVVMSALKKSERGKQILFRCYNPTKAPLDFQIKSEFQNMDTRQLDESITAQCDGNKQTLKYNQLRTYGLSNK